MFDNVTLFYVMNRHLVWDGFDKYKGHRQHLCLLCVLNPKLT